MLVLSRKVNESVIIDDKIEFTIVSIHNDRVRVGINRPRDATVSRTEHARNPLPGFWIASDIMRKLRPQFVEAVANGVPEEALAATVSAAVERASADSVAALGMQSGLK
jgi:carbon storage regulator CsrA